ncbi:hypothetical protein BGZ65_000489 [Modicella reniformis]|uniref:FAD-binding domain-containing protein n=1 Tax=Modicella reniformis TaxID=1440133 RepID=A0A9P6J2F8_9FUNG|nr:hypothetical protein BGZ65_000489 [Modicella reniformis]
MNYLHTHTVASSTTSPTSGPKHLHVLIVGAGLGGITLGIMLERAGISYHILERSSGIRPAGSAISIGPTVMRVMAQLGLMEEFLRESKPVRQLRFFEQMDANVDRDLYDGIADMMFCEARYGHAIRVIPRPILYHILFSRIPPHKVIFCKRVIRTLEYDPDGDGGSNGFISCFCDDGSEYRGSVLVGADGAYSTIRQQMFSLLEEKGEVAEGVSALLQPHQHCISGMTKPLDPKEFSALGEDYGEFQVLRGKGQTHSLWLMPLTNYRIAWTLFCYLPEDFDLEYKAVHVLPRQQQSAPTSCLPSSSERPWYHLCEKIHDRAQAMLDSLRFVPNPLSNAGGVFGDLLDKTDPERISKVTIEQGVFCRWYYRRTVLIGDACHKSLPYAGQGANQAILDSIFLASQLHNFVSSTRTTATGTPPPTRSKLMAIFDLYYRERSGIASVATNGSNWFDHIIGGRGFSSRILRYGFFWFLPQKLFFLLTDQFFQVRPLLPYLPSILDTGCIAPVPFPSS